MTSSSSFAPAEPPYVLLIGGGMITKVQVLPSLYQLQRTGQIGGVGISARRRSTLEPLLSDPDLAAAFPGHRFTPWPASDGTHPEGYQEALDALPPQSIVYIAIPDQNHYEVLCETLARGHHCICVKPLVLDHRQALDVQRRAREAGLFVGVEYHKRYDDRSAIARKKYRAGQLGEFKLGQARLHEKWYYRDSNFMHWCTTDQTDFFTYIGCHYVDLVAFITGLRPTAVSVHGIPDAFPNGNVGYLYTDARVIWENGAVLNVQNGIAYPNQAAGGNDQGICFYTKDEKTGQGGFVSHVDNYRGVSYCAIEAGSDPGDTAHHYVNPDYFQMVERSDGPGLRPVGYGFRAIEQLVAAALRVARAGDLPARQQEIDRIDAEGWHATPANSFYNELVVEAGRISILNNGATVRVRYGDAPGVG
ncbi:MAG: Gfo/Idh/MocA family protein [Verrucomicrobiales bacterium]|nr:Gfo/Idh/MocA family oxidoreductase [Verrucomicrobiae bacterium]